MLMKLSLIMVRLLEVSFFPQSFRLPSSFLLLSFFFSFSFLFLSFLPFFLSSMLLIPFISCFFNFSLHPQILFSFSSFSNVFLFLFFFFFFLFFSFYFYFFYLFLFLLCFLSKLTFSRFQCEQ